MRFQTKYQLKYPSLLLGCLVALISLQLLGALFGQSGYRWEDKLISLPISMVIDIIIFLHYRFPTRAGAIVLQVLVVLAVLLLIGLFVLLSLIFSPNSRDSQSLIQFIAVIAGLLVFHGFFLVAVRVKRTPAKSMVEENGRP